MLNDDEQRRWEQQGLGGFLKLISIGIDDYGDLENIPEGFEEFFSDDLLESAELTKLQLTSENKWDPDDEPDN